MFKIHPIDPILESYLLAWTVVVELVFDWQVEAQSAIGASGQSTNLIILTEAITPTAVNAPHIRKAVSNNPVNSARYGQ